MKKKLKTIFNKKLTSILVSSLFFMLFLILFSHFVQAASLTFSIQEDTVDENTDIHFEFNMTGADHYEFKWKDVNNGDVWSSDWEYLAATSCSFNATGCQVKLPVGSYEFSVRACSDSASVYCSGGVEDQLVVTQASATTTATTSTSTATTTNQPTNFYFAIQESTLKPGEDMHYKYYADGADHYEYYWRLKDGDWSTSTIFSNNNCPAYSNQCIFNVTASGDYDYMARACAGSGIGEDCTINVMDLEGVSVESQAYPTNRIFELQSNTVNIGDSLYFKYSADGAHHYKYMYRVAGDSWGSNWTSLGSNICSYSDSDCQVKIDIPGTYDIRLAACGDSGINYCLSSIETVVVGSPIATIATIAKVASATQPTNLIFAVQEPTVALGEDVHYMYFANGADHYEYRWGLTSETLSDAWEVLPNDPDCSYYNENCKLITSTAGVYQYEVRACTGSGTGEDCTNGAIAYNTVTDPAGATASQSCGDCGSGILNFCDSSECSLISPSCQFVSGTLTTLWAGSCTDLGIVSKLSKSMTSDNCDSCSGDSCTQAICEALGSCYFSPKSPAWVSPYVASNSCNAETSHVNNPGRIPVGVALTSGNGPYFVLNSSEAYFYAYDQYLLNYGNRDAISYESTAGDIVVSVSQMEMINLDTNPDWTERTDLYTRVGYSGCGNGEGMENLWRFYNSSTNLHAFGLSKDESYLNGLGYSKEATSIGCVEAGNISLSQFFSGATAVTITDTCTADDVTCYTTAFNNACATQSSLQTCDGGYYWVDSQSISVGGQSWAVTLCTSGKQWQSTAISGCDYGVAVTTTPTSNSLPTGTLTSTSCSNGAVTVTGSASDPDDTSTPTALHVYKDTELLGSCTTGTADVFSCGFSGVLDGTYSITVYAIDHEDATQNFSFNGAQPVTCETDLGCGGAGCP